jgi:PKD repeat protein
MTGNESIKEAINDYMEEFVKKGPIAHPSLQLDLREYSRGYSSIALGYEFNKDERLKNILEIMTNDMLDSRDDPPILTVYGRNLERGYVWMDGNLGLFLEPTCHSLFVIPIHPQDVWQGLRILKKYDLDYSRVEDFEDYLLGLAQFIYHELFFNQPGGNDFGYIYDHLLHNANKWEDGSEPKNSIRKDDSSRAMWFAFRKTGDLKYLERGKKILAFGGGVGSSTPYPAQDLMYVDLYGANGIWSYINDINVANNGNNSYTLTWKVPEGAVAYQIKYSDKQVVDWLGFNQATRNYEYDPDQYTAFFAAANLDNEPQPAQPGSMQSVTIDIPQVINSYNSIRNLTPDNPSYMTYQSDRTYYFSIKCLTNNNPPRAYASADITSGTMPLTVNFVGSGNDQDGDIVSYIWDFSDGNSINAKNTSHTFEDAGDYNVTLQVIDDKGAMGIASIVISVTSSDENPIPPPDTDRPDPPKGLKVEVLDF